MRIINSSGIKLIHTDGTIEQIAYNDIKTLHKVGFGVPARDNIVIRTYRGQQVRIPFDSVTEPLTADADALMEVIRLYNLRMGNKQEYEASVGQTNFTTTFELTGAESYTIDGSDQKVYFNRVSDYEFVFTGPDFRGGENVTVKN